MYKVISPFKDLEENHIYKTGDVFPFDKKEISVERIKSLSTDKNKTGKPLIEKIEDKKEASKKNTKIKKK